MNYHIVTYGCQMNKSDSERIASILESAGLRRSAGINKADLLVVNSCSVRQSAINRIYGMLKNFKSATGQEAKTILTGCILESDKKKFKDRFDLMIDIKELTENPEKLMELLNSLSGKQEFTAFNYTDYFKINPQYRSNFSAYVPIMTGCNNFCAYCAVPYTRGREISRPAKEIAAEIERLVKKGYKEITLLGQNINSYHSGAADFPRLLKTINDIPGNFWIRFLTSHPKDMSNELIKIMAKCEKVCEYVHLPIQSGDNEILRKMNRRYTAAQYLELINKILLSYNLDIECPSILGHSMSKSTWHPPLAVSTDIIVGFPGETKKQFANTAKIMRNVKFDMAYLAEYSSRAGTTASKLKDDVPVLEKKRRKKFLNEILKKTALENNKKYVGKTVEVLIEKTEGNFAFGKTRTLKNVKILLTGNGAAPAVASAKAGQFARIKITKANAWGLKGELV